jgi:hypothetical protein
MQQEDETGSRFEEEGIPDLQDGTPAQQQASDPQEMPLPGDRPVAVDDYGTTAEEQFRGESLDGRLGREEPDVGAGAPPPEDSTRPTLDHAGRLVAPDAGAHPDDEPDAVADDLGADGGGYTAEERAMHVEDDR